MTEPFDYLNSIMFKKEYLMDDEDNEKKYPPFMVNRGLSQHIDCLLFSNEMNIHYDLDNKLQYDYLYHSIRKMHRKLGKWAKRPDDDIVGVISKYFKVNIRRAREFASLMTEKQKREVMMKGETNG